MKLLIIAACFINLGEDGGAADYAVGDFADVPKDTARTLTEHGRALYCDRKDDHMKDARFTATAEEIKAAQSAAKAAAKSAQAQAQAEA